MAELRSDDAQNWMAPFGIKKGEYLSVTKSQLKTQQRPDKPLKVQVWATGILHTAGYQGEVAMTMRGGKKVPLAPNDIINELHAVAVKYFKDGGIQATEEELQKLKETKETIRRALFDLEEDGIAQRTDLQGTPVANLSPADQKKLANGKVRLHFWLKPKNATAKTVEQDWQERTAKPNPHEVDKNRLLVPAIWKILNVFQIAKPGKKQLSDVQFQAKVTHAYESARAVFMQEISVDIACLLSPVDTPCSPEVDTGRGAFEIKGEIKETPRSAPLSKDILKRTPPPLLTPGNGTTGKAAAAALYSQFKSLYPPCSFDEPKARPAFEAKTPEAQTLIVERLQVYLACENWQQTLKEDGGRYVPFASKWLTSYESDPPPLKKSVRRGGFDDEAILKLMDKVG